MSDTFVPPAYVKEGDGYKLTAGRKAGQVMSEAEYNVYKAQCQQIHHAGVVKRQKKAAQLEVEQPKKKSRQKSVPAGSNDDTKYQELMKQMVDLKKLMPQPQPQPQQPKPEAVKPKKPAVKKDDKKTLATLVQKGVQEYIDAQKKAEEEVREKKKAEKQAKKVQVQVEELPDDDEEVDTEYLGQLNEPHLRDYREIDHEDDEEFEAAASAAGGDALALDAAFKDGPIIVPPVFMKETWDTLAHAEAAFQSIFDGNVRNDHMMDRSPSWAITEHIDATTGYGVAGRSSRGDIKEYNRKWNMRQNQSLGVDEPFDHGVAADPVDPSFRIYGETIKWGTLNFPPADVNTQSYGVIPMVLLKRLTIKVLSPQKYDAYICNPTILAASNPEITSNLSYTALHELGFYGQRSELSSFGSTILPIYDAKGVARPYLDTIFCEDWFDNTRHQARMAIEPDDYLDENKHVGTMRWAEKVSMVYEPRMSKITDPSQEENTPLNTVDINMKVEQTQTDVMEDSGVLMDIDCTTDGRVGILCPNNQLWIYNRQSFKNPCAGGAGGKIPENANDIIYLPYVTDGLEYEITATFTYVYVNRPSLIEMAEVYNLFDLKTVYPNLGNIYGSVTADVAQYTPQVPNPPPDATDGPTRSIVKHVWRRGEKLPETVEEMEGHRHGYPHYCIARGHAPAHSRMVHPKRPHYSIVPASKSIHMLYKRADNLDLVRQTHDGEAIKAWKAHARHTKYRIPVEARFTTEGLGGYQFIGALLGPLLSVGTSMLSALGSGLQTQQQSMPPTQYARYPDPNPPYYPPYPQPYPYPRDGNISKRFHSGVYAVGGLQCVGATLALKSGDEADGASDNIRDLTDPRETTTFGGLTMQPKTFILDTASTSAVVSHYGGLKVGADPETMPITAAVTDASGADMLRANVGTSDQVNSMLGIMQVLGSDNIVRYVGGVPEYIPANNDDIYKCNGDVQMIANKFSTLRAASGIEYPERPFMGQQQPQWSTQYRAMFVPEYAHVVTEMSEQSAPNAPNPAISTFTSTDEAFTVTACSNGHTKLAIPLTVTVSVPSKGWGGLSAATVSSGRLYWYWVGLGQYVPSTQIVTTGTPVTSMTISLNRMTVCANMLPRVGQKVWCDNYYTTTSINENYTCQYGPEGWAYATFGADGGGINNYTVDGPNFQNLVTVMRGCLEGGKGDMRITCDRSFSYKTYKTLNAGTSSFATLHWAEDVTFNQGSVSPPSRALTDANMQYYATLDICISGITYMERSQNELFQTVNNFDRLFFGKNEAYMTVAAYKEYHTRCTEPNVLPFKTSFSQSASASDTTDGVFSRKRKRAELSSDDTPYEDDDQYLPEEEEERSEEVNEDVGTTDPAVACWHPAQNVNSVFATRCFKYNIAVPATMGRLGLNTVADSSATGTLGSKNVIFPVGWCTQQDLNGDTSFAAANRLQPLGTHFGNYRMEGGYDGTSATNALNYFKPVTGYKQRFVTGEYASGTGTYDATKVYLALVHFSDVGHLDLAHLAWPL